MKVGLERFDRSHPIAALKGSGNLISFYILSAMDITLSSYKGLELGVR
jgi:hypothetical protein